MKTLVLFGVIAAALAVPVPEADPDCDKLHVIPAPALPYAGFGFAPGPVAAAPVAYAAPVSYAAPAEVKIPITTTHVEVPLHQQILYGAQNYVAGHNTAIYKPSLVAPAIAPPSVLLSRLTQKAPEVTITKQEIPVEHHVPKFVDTPYHAGTVIKYTAPEVKEVKVPTPYAQPVPVSVPVAVAQPVPVAQPVAVAAIPYTAAVLAKDC